MQYSAGAHHRWRLPDFLLPDPVRFRTEGGGGDDGGSGDGGGDGGAGGPGGQQQDPPAGDGGGSGENTLSAEDARKLRSESRNLRQRLKDAEGERDKLRDAQQSDTERLQTSNTELTTSNQRLQNENRNLRAQVVAGRVGIVDPEIAAGLVDWSDAEDDAALERQFKGILKAKPYLAGNVAGGADGASRGGSGGDGGGEEDMNTLLRRRAGVIQ